MWCGARKGRSVASRPVPMPAALWTWVISSASSKLGGGRMPGSRRASMVLPAPGGPIISRLWPPAAAISSARLASSCPRTSARSGPSGLASSGSATAGRAGSGDQRPWSRSASRASVGIALTSIPSTSAASAAFASGTSRRR